MDKPRNADLRGCDYPSFSPLRRSQVCLSSTYRLPCVVRSLLYAAQASRSGGTTDVRLIAWVAPNACLISDEVAPGNCDHSRAIAPVTNAAAALVPPDRAGLPFGPRLVTAAPGALTPCLPIELPRFEDPNGRPSWSHAATGTTQGSRVIAEPANSPWFPAAATTSAPRLRACPSALLSFGSSFDDGGVKAALTLMTQAPDRTQSTIAAASSPGVAAAFERPAASSKIGRSSSVHAGQMAGAGEYRFATKMPATKVPCAQAGFDA